MFNHSRNISLFYSFLHTSTIIIDITLISIAYLALYIGISYLTKSSGLNIYLNVFKRLLGDDVLPFLQDQTVFWLIINTHSFDDDIGIC